MAFLKKTNIKKELGLAILVSVDNFGICLMVSFEGCDYFREERLLVQSFCNSNDSSFVLNSANLFSSESRISYGFSHHPLIRIYNPMFPLFFVVS